MPSVPCITIFEKRKNTHWKWYHAHQHATHMNPSPPTKRAKEKCVVWAFQFHRHHHQHDQIDGNYFKLTENHIFVWIVGRSASRLYWLLHWFTLNEPSPPYTRFRLLFFAHFGYAIWTTCPLLSLYTQRLVDFYFLSSVTPIFFYIIICKVHL